jgi:RNA polymerase sigma-70 factor (ECF subfamily)
MAAVGVDFVSAVHDAPFAATRAEQASRRAAFERLVREHEAALLAFATRLAGAPSDARDLVQDALERALSRFDTFEQGTNARAWLFTILHRAFIDRCRRRAVEKRTDCIDDVQIAAPEPLEPPRWADVTADQLAAAVERLDDDFRNAYRLHAVEALSYQDIAARLSIPVNTVGTRLARARKKLRALLEGAMEREGRS